MSDNPSAREEGFYWVVLGQNPPEIAYWERGDRLAGDARPWQPAAVNVLSDKLVFRPRLTPVAGRAPWHAWRTRRDDRGEGRHPSNHEGPMRRPLEEMQIASGRLTGSPIST